MSIEIKELLVKFNVTGRKENSKASNVKTLSHVDYKKMVKDCTEKVLKELEFKIER